MTKAQILIVEDDRIVAEDIQSSLQNLGYTVSAIAPSGAEALVRVKEGNPDLVLMDIVLKGKMNGIEAADQIRSQFDIPVVYLTAYADEELLDQARITEPFGYILKPFEERELNTVIEIALYKHKMEKRLREGEKQWKSITENSPDYIMTLDPDANILFVNHTLSELTREQVIGSSFYDYALPGYKEVAEDCFEGVLKTGKPGGFESVYEDPNGNLHFFESYVGPVLQSGKVVGLTVSSRDVTERKRAEVALQESEEKYRSMMEAMTAPVYICSPDFRVEYMNTSMIRRTGRDATGGLCYEAINDLKEKCSWCVHEKIQKGEHAETEIVSPKDGHTYNVSHSPIFHVDGSISKMTIYRDVTQHKRAEDALRNSERELSIRNRIAETFLITSDEETYGKVLEVVLEAMRSKYGTFAYINENGDRVVPSLTRDIWDECQVRDKNIVFPRETWGNNLWAKCLIEKKAISSNGPFRVPDGHIPVTRVLAVPIIYQDEAIGNFMVGNKATDYDEADEKLLKRIATHTAPILRARLEKDIQHRKRERAEKALLKARDDLEQRVKERTAELQSLSSRLLDVQEDERKRIAGDLHDGIGQSLSTIKFSIESVLDRLEEETDPSTLDTLRSLVSMLQDSIEDVRNTVMNLRPSILDDLGIIATTSWFFRQFQTIYSGIRVEEQIDVQETEVPDALKTNIFRVLQEATNNVAKHSKADRMRVALGKNEGAVELVIEDNGRGFDPRSVPTAEDGETGFGITSMKERTELSGGSFSIESKKGAGTTVRASWPYRSE